MPDAMKDERVSTFHAVRAAELAAIAERRTARRLPDTEAEIKSSLVGLALSGGGIRSATFALGVLQGFHELRHLAKFDYLSTVSGGGFTGAWWTTWLSRKMFLASHIHDEEALAKRVINELAPRDALAVGIADARVTRFDTQTADAVDKSVQERTGDTTRAWQQLLSALALATGSGIAGDRSAGRKRLLELLVFVLEALARIRTVDRVFANYGSLLTREFPADENLEPQRASDYSSVKVPDGALAAGADPIHHVRLFANYLTPRKGLMSVDTWRAAAVVSRNLIFTWCALLPILLAVVLAGHLYFVAQPFDVGVADRFVPTPAMDGDVGAQALRDRAAIAARIPIAFGIGVVVVALLWIGVNHAGSPSTHMAAMIGGTLVVAGALVLLLRPEDCRGLACVTALWPAPDPDATRAQRVWNALYVAAVVVGVGMIAADIIRIRESSGASGAPATAGRAWWNPIAILAGLVAVVIGPEMVERRLREPVYRQVAGNRATRWHGSLLTWFTVALVTFAFAGFAHEAIAWLLAAPATLATLDIGKTVATLTALAAFAGSLFTAIKGSPSSGRDARDAGRPTLVSRLVFAITPPLVLLVLAAAMAWAGHRLLVHVTHEWGDVQSILTVMAQIGIAICLVYGVGEVRRTAPAGWFQYVLILVLGFAAVGVAWLVVRDWQAWAANPSPRAVYALTAGVIWVVVAWAWWRLGDRRWRPVVLVGFCGAAVSVLLVASIALTGDSSPATTASFAAATVLIVVLAWVFTVGWMSDPNALGLHTFYKARLVRAYLGASNPTRHVSGRDIHDSVVDDDIPLAKLTPTAAGGPYPLINTTLNLVGGRELATAQRSAAYFVLSPKFCGSVRTGYRPTQQYMGGKLTVGAAVATSGAAASPNMGSRTPSAALAVLLTFFNVRLGLWVPTPHKVHWATPQARLWPFYLLRESFSQTNDLGSYCYLTDGGHFDNTGLYSLIERGCRTIVLVDNGADPKPPSFGDLGETIRRCRIDFGAEIDLTVNAFRDRVPAPAHYTLGTVRYAPAHLRELGIGRDEMEGRIVWIKPSLIGTEPADVVQYGFQNAVFPQQATSDQWFDEAQFESYRQLALESVRSLLDEQPGILDPA